MRLVVGLSGASGVQYGIRLLEVLKDQAHVDLIISSGAKEIIQLETGLDIEFVYDLASSVYENDDMKAPISSGSVKFDGEVIVPCSMKTLGCIANGISDTLISRVADVCLKEGKALILVPRETPLSLVHCENLLKVKRAGAVVMPASPGFYTKPSDISDLIDFIVGRIMDSLGMEHDISKRWDGDTSGK
ncbi:MAG: UbiX family flavin prenyltransferase [Halobacteriota archaeon]|nr:UbiX family flavin prenyltransferase [Halobacteriota archaeon]